MNARKLEVQGTNKLTVSSQPLLITNNLNIADDAVLAQLLAAVAAALVLAALLVVITGGGIGALSMQSIGTAFKHFTGPMMGVPSSLASAFKPVVISVTSCARFPACFPEPCIN